MDLKTKKLFIDIKGLIDEARSSVTRQVNTIMIYTYYHIGKIIIEEEQGGSEKASYSKETLKQLSILLTKEYGKGYSQDNLEKMRKFYTTYNSRISESLIRKSDQSILAAFQKYFQVSWTHYFHLLKISDNDERNFYEQQSSENNWSIREMQRQISSAYYERTRLSKGNSCLLSDGHDPIESLKSPFVLEFLNLSEESTYSESDLETAIINKLEEFMLELGKGFLFESRQKRITLDGDHFYIDLSFYNRILKCFVLIDLKIGKLTHQDIGQMQMYVNYHDRKIKLPDENPTIGIILCKQENKSVVEFTLPEDNKQIYSREYKLYLPSKEDLKKLL